MILHNAVMACKSKAVALQGVKNFSSHVFPVCFTEDNDKTSINIF